MFLFLTSCWVTINWYRINRVSFGNFRLHTCRIFFPCFSVSYNDDTKAENIQTINEGIFLSETSDFSQIILSIERNVNNFCLKRNIHSSMCSETDDQDGELSRSLLQPFSRNLSLQRLPDPVQSRRRVRENIVCSSEYLFQCLFLTSPSRKQISFVLCWRFFIKLTKKAM